MAGFAAPLNARRSTAHVVAHNWDKYDFFFVHIKYTDSRGEDGDFEAKSKVIEGVDAALPQLMALKPDVLIVADDVGTR